MFNYKNHKRKLKSLIEPLSKKRNKENSIFLPIEIIMNIMNYIDFGDLNNFFSVLTLSIREEIESLVDIRLNNLLKKFSIDLIGDCFFRLIYLYKDKIEKMLSHYRNNNNVIFISRKFINNELRHELKLYNDTFNKLQSMDYRSIDLNKSKYQRLSNVANLIEDTKEYFFYLNYIPSIIKQVKMKYIYPLEFRIDSFFNVKKFVLECHNNKDLYPFELMRDIEILEISGNIENINLLPYKKLKDLKIKTNGTIKKLIIPEELELINLQIYNCPKLETIDIFNSKIEHLGINFTKDAQINIKNKINILEFNTDSYINFLEDDNEIKELNLYMENSNQMNFSENNYINILNIFIKENIKETIFIKEIKNLGSLLINSYNGFYFRVGEILIDKLINLTKLAINLETTLTFNNNSFSELKKVYFKYLNNKELKLINDLEIIKINECNNLESLNIYEWHEIEIKNNKSLRNINIKNKIHEIHSILIQGNDNLIQINGYNNIRSLHKMYILDNESLKGYYDLKGMKINFLYAHNNNDDFLIDNIPETTYYEIDCVYRSNEYRYFEDKVNEYFEIENDAMDCLFKECMKLKNENSDDLHELMKILKDKYFEFLYEKGEMNIDLFKFKLREYIDFSHFSNQQIEDLYKEYGKHYLNKFLK